MSLTADNSMQRQMAEIEEIIAQVEKHCGDAVGQDIERVVRLVLDMHRDTIKRILWRLRQAGPAGAALLGVLVEDDLVANLLLLYDLHPMAAEQRVRTAIEKIRPYLQSHGGDVELLGIDQTGANLRMQGGCGECPAMVSSLKAVIERAIYDVAPDLAGINIQAATSSAVNP